MNLQGYFKLVVDGLSSIVRNQECLGNCWLVAACSALALEKKLWERVSWTDQVRGSVCDDGLAKVD